MVIQSTHLNIISMRTLTLSLIHFLERDIWLQPKLNTPEMMTLIFHLRTIQLPETGTDNSMNMLELSSQRIYGWQNTGAKRLLLYKQVIRTQRNQTHLTLIAVMMNQRTRIMSRLNGLSQLISVNWMITLQCTENLIRITLSVVLKLVDGPTHSAGLIMDMTMM